METLGTKIIKTQIIKGLGLALLGLMAGSATSQSAPPASAAAIPAAHASAAPSAITSASPTAAAQQQKAADPTTPTADDSLTTIRATSNEVNVVFTVTDKHGRRVTDLKQADFHVLDDNKPPQEIRSFHAETNLPLQVGLLIDASNSVRDRFKFEQQSAIEFLNQTIHPRVDQAFVVGFDVTPEVTQDFTDNTELLAHGVHELRPDVYKRQRIRCATLRHAEMPKGSRRVPNVYRRVHSRPVTRHSGSA